jgi:hypothetical protein
VKEERRTLYDAMNRRSIEELERLGRRFAEFEWRSAPDEIDSDTRQGAASALSYSRSIFGPDQPILVVSHDARGAASGVQTGRREAHLWTFRLGGAVSLREYPTVEEAREAAGR